MDEEFEFRVLNSDEVLFVSAGRVLMNNPTFKVGEFLDALAQLVSEREADWSDDDEGWFGEGLDCEALRFGNQGWQRGRVRIRLEFCPARPPKLLNEGRRDPRSANNPLRDSDRPMREVYLQPDDHYIDDDPDDFISDY